MEILEILKAAAYIIVVTATPVLVKEALNLFNKKIDQEQEGNKKLQEQEELNKAIDDAQDAISAAVKYVSQTYVDALKKAGRFSADAQAEARTKCIVKAKELLPEASKKAITIIYGNIDKYIETMLEVNVLENKKEA